jgi:hypothetical protein
LLRRDRLHDRLFWGPDDFIPNDLLIMPQLMVQGGCLISLTSTYDFRIHQNNTSLAPQRNAVLRLNLMTWYGIRWLAQFLVSSGYTTLGDLEVHGSTSSSFEHHVVPLVLALGSYSSPRPMRRIAQSIFRQRRDLDIHSARLRLARIAGFWTIPLSERITQQRVRWYG